LVSCEGKAASNTNTDDANMYIRVKCVAVVEQGVEKILIQTTDDLAMPEEQMILNLSPLRGRLFVGGKTYRITIEEEGD